MKTVRDFVQSPTATKARHSRTGVLVLSFVLGILILAACGGRSQPAAQPASPSSGQSSNAAAPQATTPSTKPPAGSDQSNGGEFGLQEAEVAKRVDAVESLVATCMRDAGFEYIPVDYTTVRTAMDSNSRPSGMKGDEFRAQYGYGITTLLTDASQAVMSEGEQNMRIRSGLSIADRTAYLHALYGDNPTATFVVGLDSENFSQVGGCTRSAVQQTFSPAELGPNFVNYQNAQGARIDQDPRLIAALKDWATCMRDAGYSYNNGNEIKSDLAQQLDAITHGAAPNTLSTEAQATLKKLQGEELAFAAADHQCNVKYVDTIRVKIETELFGAQKQP